MKKLLVLFIFTLTLISLTSCKYNVSRNKAATNEEIQEFLDSKTNPFYDGNVSFEYYYTYTETRNSKSLKYSTKNEIFAYGTVDEDLVGSIHYESIDEVKSVTTTLSGNEKTTSKNKEEGICFLRSNSDDNKYYFTIDINIKIPYGKIKKNLLKSTLESDSVSLNKVIRNIKLDLLSLNSKNYGEMVNEFKIIIPTNSFSYLSKNKVKVVQSYSTMHTETVYIFKDDQISSIKTTQQSQNDNISTYIEKEIIFKNVKEVKVPKDAANYKTEYQQYEPGFFDNISFGLVLLIITIIAILVATLIIVLRIVKRPKYQEE